MRAVVTSLRSLGFGLGIWLTAASGAADDDRLYPEQVRPLLREKCYACHGALKQEGGLRLDTAAAARQGSSTGPVVVLSDVAASPLLQRVMAADAAERMPPEGPPLSDAQVESLRTWISRGAPGPAQEAAEQDPREHWSFRPPTRPALPLDPTFADRVDNPLDTFIEAGLQARELESAEPASRATQLRRVYLDLIGLPPSREQLEEFLADEAPDAYDRVVDRLLHTPQYGERWGRHWLDVWRYSDWYGRRMVPDVWNSAPQVWRWRDWTVRSLNQDQGYDHLVRSMLAADEVSPEDPEANYATAYLIRNWYALNPNDWMRQNVEHTAKAFLGLTFHCAHCHDHKYDPITQVDYFRLRAFFEPIGIRQDRVPGEADPGPFQEYDYSVLRKIVRLGAVRIYDKNPELPTWFYTGGDERNRVTENGSQLPGMPEFLGGDKLALAPLELPPAAWYPGLQPQLQQSLRAEVERSLQADAQLLQAGQTHAAQQLPLLQQQLDAALASQAQTAADGTQAEIEVQRARRAHQIEQLKLRVLETQALASGGALASLDARMAADQARYASPPAPDAADRIKAAALAEREASVQQAEKSLAAAELAKAEAEHLPAEDAGGAAKLESATKQQTEAQAALEKARGLLADPAGLDNYTSLTPQYPKQSTGRRKALAEWLTQPDHPLTARVAINHLWLRHFHQPLVATVFDFGRSGARPTHPELLDWLAIELTRADWRMKPIHRLVVTSRAYRRASQLPADARAMSEDPANALLARMNVGRMEAEVVRDSLWYLADQLDLQIGGQELENSEALTTRRRTLYYSCQPELDGKSPFGALFDAPEPADCYRRTRSVIPQQALALTNSELIHASSPAIAAQLTAVATSEAGDDPVQAETRFIAAAFAQILSRPPAAAEQDLCRQFLQQQQARIAVARPQEASQAAREALVRVLFNHNDFIAIR